ncbi:MAG: prolipoprotein diacylglyceryl transferase [Planctomycetaceae bacterium]|nr:prolipoprotein diacylglyceryl transferase [Planctomycetaceae bacterium]
MRRTLFHIPLEIFGLPVFGFGILFFLLCTAVAAAVLWRYKTVKKIDEDIKNYLGLLLVGAAIIVFVVPTVAEGSLGFPIRGYGFFLLIAILSAVGLAIRLAKPKGVSAETVLSLGIWTVVSGILGARIFYVAEYYKDMAAYDPNTGAFSLGGTLWNIVNIPDGGLVVYGSIIGGLIGALIYMRLNKLPVFPLLDSMAPAAALGMCLGRIGCLMNGCCYGGITDVPWGIVFPEGSPAHLHQIEHGETFQYGMTFTEVSKDGEQRVVVKETQRGSTAVKSGIQTGDTVFGIGVMHQGRPASWNIHSLRELIFILNEIFNNVPIDETVRFDIGKGADITSAKPFFFRHRDSDVRAVHPTQIYSSVSALCGCFVLLGLGRLRQFRSRDGMLFAAFLLLYPAIRFCLEIIRTDEDSFLGTGLTVSQCVSIAVFFAGIVFTAWLMRKAK